MKKPTSTHSKLALKPKAPMTQAERDAVLKKNWGTKAYNTVKRFRKIWDEEGAKLA